MSLDSTQHRSDNFDKIMISTAVMLVAILEVMDITIVNVALPNMMGSLNANAEQISWVLTSYVVSSAIVMLLTGYLVNIMGRRRLLLIAIFGFMLSSCLCGISETLTQIVIFRSLQGVFGATLVPLSQYILRDSFPPEKQGVAMAIWGMGIMVAPVLGPALGGIITDILNWRWTFFINLPISLVALAMCIQFVTDTPRKKVRLDFLGLILMAASIGSLQIFLDQGNAYNWFASNGILILFVCMVLSFIWFISRGINMREHIINFKIFLNYEFTMSTIVFTVYLSVVFGMITIQPLMLENLLHYSPTNAGLVLAPRGLACMFGLFMVAKLIERLGAKSLAAFGIFMCAVGSFMMANFNLAVDPYWIIASCLVQGFGMGFVFVPLTTLAMSTLKPDQVAEGTGIFNFGRSLGTSIGISVLITMLTRMSQVTWNGLSGHINTANPVVSTWLAKLNLTIDSELAPQLLAMELHRQSSMLAFVDCFYFSGIALLVVIPFLLLVRDQTRKKPNTNLQSDERVKSS